MAPVIEAAVVRLLLVSGCTGYVFGLVVIAGWLGSPSAVVSGVVGVVLAVALTEDWDERSAGARRRVPHRSRRRTSSYDGED